MSIAATTDEQLYTRQRRLQCGRVEVQIILPVFAILVILRGHGNLLRRWFMYGHRLYLKAN